MILVRIIEIVATRCQILRLQCTNFDFGCGSAPDSAWEINSAPPDTLDAFKGPTSRGREEGKWKGKEGQGGEGEKGKGGERKGWKVSSGSFDPPRM